MAKTSPEKLAAALRANLKRRKASPAAVPAKKPPEGPEKPAPEPKKPGQG